MESRNEQQCIERVLGSNKTRKEIPVDHGWAWCVLLGASVNITALMIFVRATSLLFISFLDIYQASSTMTTLVFSLSSITFSASNIVASTVLIKHFEVRSLCLAGAVLNFFTIVGIAYAPDIIVMNILFAVLGFAHGLIVVPQLTLLGHYFNKRLSLATATTTIGISLATVGGTPITQILLDTYGVRGTVLILAGVTLHCVPASMLLRPISYYSVTPSSTSDKDSETQNNETDKFLCKRNQGDSVLIEEQVVLIKERDETSPEMGHKRRHFKLLSNNPQRRQRSVSESWHVTVKLDDVCRLRSGSQFGDSSCIKEINGDERKHSNMTASISNILSQSLKYLNDTSSLYGSSLTQYPRIARSKIYDENYIEVQKSSTEEEMASENQVNGKGETKKTFSQKVREFASKSVYTNPVAVLLLISSGLGIHAQAGVNYMPAAGVENGLTAKQISVLLTVLGIADVISKFAVGVLADTGIISRIRIACLSQLVTGLVFQVVILFQGFMLMLVLQVVVGFCIGVFHVLLPVITVDFLGVQHMGHIVSGYMLINGVVNALDHLVVGSLRDFTGSLYGSYHYMGSLALMSAVMLLAQPLVHKCFPNQNS